MATNILETRIIATDEASAKLALIVDQFRAFGDADAGRGAILGLLGQQ